MSLVASLKLLKTKTHNVKHKKTGGNERNPWKKAKKKQLKEMNKTKTVQELKMEKEALKKTQIEGILEMKTSKGTETTETSFINRM